MGKFFGMVCVAVPLFAQVGGIEGEWQGTLNTGTLKMRLAFHVTKDANGYSTKIDSIDQGVKGIPVAKTTFDGGKVHMDIPGIQGNFDGTLTADGKQIQGTFTQGAGLPLTLERVGKIAELKRPQEPKPPFPYDATEVTYENDGIKLAGTLTTPKTGGPFAAALMITGSGPQDRDESLMGHKPFWVIADFLTRHGVAVLRVDDRGMGKSTGKSTQTTIQEMAKDVLAGVAFLKTRKEIDAKRIGVIGHSEGGIVGPLAAAQSPDISFVILLAGTGVTGEQVLYLQSEMIEQSMGLGDAAVAANRKIQELIFNTLRTEQGADTMAAIAKLKEAWKSQYGGDAPRAIEVQFESITQPELRSFLFYDPAETLKKLKVPVLALNGSRDVQVPAKQNLPAIVTALTAGGNPDVTAVELPGLNHLFQHCKTCAPAEYGDLEETFSPEAMEIMAQWLTRHGM